ncbi:GMC family oxidoreductase [Rhodopila sp.]|uniref:GMC family oxidoreductase n=1 Tax=Rhodopila sp. TaxID=2480087 RepID=UPI003D1184C3
MYDVIVVGGGSAGAPAAAHLSADPARRVLLLEAGRDWRAADAPAAMRSANIIPFMNDPAHQAEWQWPHLMTRRTRTQPPRFYWRGKALGGSSAVNAQIATRGVADAFDTWAEAGCEGWSAAEVLPVMQAFEDDPAQGRTGGRVPVYRAPEALWGPVDRGLRDAAHAAGYAWNPDLNAATGEGISCYPFNVRNGRRISANEAFLEPVRDRPNLEIIGGALVDRVLLTDGGATGVRVHLADRGWMEIHAREVLICAGAIHSPAILLRSGLGSAADLRALGISVARNMPEVGGNFMDHPTLRASLALRPDFVSRDPDQRHTNCCVTYTSGLAGGGRRDMIMIGFNHRAIGQGEMPSGTGAVGASLFNAFSRGRVRLASSNPATDPLVEENMLDDPRDVLRMRDAVRRLAILVAHPALADLATAITFHDSGLNFDAVAAMPEDVLDGLMLDQAADAQHAAGTCRMTAYEEPRGVVDPDLRVKGVRGLRVADASIMPADCRANTNFTCMMIGVMAARLIVGAGQVEPEPTAR